MDKFNIIQNFIQQIQNGIFVEIGTFEGELADFILQNSTNSKLYCIDPYVSYEEYNDTMNTIVGDYTYSVTYNKLKNKYGERIQFIRKFSKDAVNDIPNQIDFLYIDGNHSYQYVFNDLQLFYNKVKNNCYIIGDDAIDIDNTKRNSNGDILKVWCKGCYGHYGVVKAFDEFCSINN